MMGFVGNESEVFLGGFVREGRERKSVDDDDDDGGGGGGGG